jgi:hypothetical protein
VAGWRQQQRATAVRAVLCWVGVTFMDTFIVNTHRAREMYAHQLESDTL